MQVKKEGKAKFKLGVAEAKLGSAIQVRTLLCVSRFYPLCIPLVRGSPSRAALACARYPVHGSCGCPSIKEASGVPWRCRQRALSSTASLWPTPCCLEPPLLPQEETGVPCECSYGKCRRGCAHVSARFHSCLQEETGVPCECNEQVGEMLRGVRQHFAT